MKKFGFIFLLMSLFASCNLYQKYVVKQMKQMNQAGLTNYTGVFPNGKRSVSFTGTFDQNKKNLLLIHGYQGSSYAQWSVNVEELSKHFNIVAPDLNYHGSTYLPSDFSIEMQSDLVKDLMQQISDYTGDSSVANAKYIVVGSSYGGLVGARFAEKYPERVSAYVSLDGLTGCFDRSFTDSVAVSAGAKDAVALLNPTTGKELKKLASLEKPVHIPNFILNQVAEQHFCTHRNEKIKLLNYLNEQIGRAHV